MPIAKCKIGFDCSLMMLCPGLSPEDCENKDNCGLIYEYSQAELIKIEKIQNLKKTAVEVFICKNPSLILSLNETLRTNHPPQQTSYNFSSFEIYILYLISRYALVFAVNELPLRQTLELINDVSSDIFIQLAKKNFIIPPVSSELSIYNVKRPKSVYKYWQLLSDKPIFKSVFSGEKGKNMRPNKKYDKLTKNIHLSKDDNPKFILVAHLINNRNKIQKALNKLKNALTLIQEALEILSSIE